LISPSLEVDDFEFAQIATHDGQLPGWMHEDIVEEFCGTGCSLIER
jgi:hypothetical protein